jgi:HD-like signal output (HDOD) protein
MKNSKTIFYELEQAVLELGIPPCPKILLDLATEGRKTEPDLQQIEKLISSDVGLSAALIKTVNSPFYGLRNKVHSIMQAIHMLGLSHLSLMVTSMVLREVLKGGSPVDMERFWDASTKVAVISSYIASRLPYIAFEHMRRVIDKDEAYTYGLFQDCGIPILLNQHANYKDTLKIANESIGRRFTDFEEAAYGHNHAMAGYILARSWGLAESMCVAIHCHHEHVALADNTCHLDETGKDFVALALLSERAIQIISGLNHTCEWQKGGQWVMQHFGISDADFSKIIDGIRILYEEGNLET